VHSPITLPYSDACDNGQMQWARGLCRRHRTCTTAKGGWRTASSGLKPLRLPNTQPKTITRHKRTCSHTLSHVTNEHAATHYHKSQPQTITRHKLSHVTNEHQDLPSASPASSASPTSSESTNPSPSFPPPVSAGPSSPAPPCVFEQLWVREHKGFSCVLAYTPRSHWWLVDLFS